MVDEIDTFHNMYFQAWFSFGGFNGY